MIHSLAKSVLWVALGYAAPLMAWALLDLTLASGYGYAFLGVWQPPHDESFRVITISCFYASLLLSLIVAVVGMIWGAWWSRLALISPLLFSLGGVVLLIWSWRG